MSRYGATLLRLTLGVIFGGLLGHGWAAMWPGGELGGYAVIGGAAVLAGSMQGPIAAVVLLLELTHGADGLMVPILLAVAGATIVARRLGAQSIYSARLSIGEDESAQAEPLGPLQPSAPNHAEGPTAPPAARRRRADDLQTDHPR